MSKYGIKIVDDPDYPVQDLEGVSYHNVAEYLWTGVLGGCGCGSADFNEDLLLKLFNYFDTPHMERDSGFMDRPEVEILAHWMDSKDLIEHGGSVGGSWLNSQGKVLWAGVKDYAIYKTEPPTPINDYE